MENDKIFSKNFFKNFSTEKKEINLKCILLQETKDLYIITPYQKFTKIKDNLVFKKFKKTFGIFKKVKPKNPVISKKFYSLFIGSFTKDKKSYLLFATKVLFCNSGDKKMKIFEIAEVDLVCEVKDRKLRMYKKILK